MKVMIFERSLSGHRVRYVQYLIEYLVTAGVRPVVILGETAEASESFRLNLAPLRGVCDFEFRIPEQSKWVSISLVHWYALYAAIRRHSPERVVIPTADRLAQMCGLFWLFWWQPSVRRAQLHVTLLGLRFGHSLKTAREIYIRLLNLCMLATARIAAIYTINEKNVYDSKQIVRALLGLRYVAEPVAMPHALDRDLARRRAGLAGEGRLVGIVGGLDARKNIALCIDALRCEEWPTATKLVLAGPLVDSAIARCIERSRPSDGLILRARLLSEEELTTTLEALDLVLVLYSQHEAPSSIVIKAAGCGIPVLATDRGWIGATVKNHNLGRTISAETATAVALAIRSTLDVYGPGCRLIADKEWLSDFAPRLFSARICGMAPTKTVSRK